MNWKWKLGIILALAPTCALAAGGKVQFSDGRPADGATVVVTVGEQQMSATCDAGGRFELPSPTEGEAVIRVRAAAKDYAQVLMPAALLANGDIAIVLPASAQ